MDIKDFISKARTIHGNKYDYSKVEYIDSKTKVCIICPEHGEFWQKPNDHLGGHGCKKCAIRDLINKRKSNIEAFISKARTIHGNKYDYSKVKYINNHTKICIICPEHGEFWQTPLNHLNGQECPMCGRKNAANKLKKNTSTFIEEAKEVHGNKYDYSKVNYINNETKVCIICPEHGEFWQVPSAHLRGQGCRDCKNSTLEAEVFSILENMSISNKRYCNIEGKLGKQSVDFYLDKENVAIECQGIQHFINIDLFTDTLEDEIERDFKKNKICQENGITIKYYIRKSIIDKYKILTDKKYRGIYNQNNIIYA